MNFQKANGLKPRRKFTPEHDQPKRYWGSYWGLRNGFLFTLEDGSIGKDKSKGLKSSPGKKQTLRQANRSLKKATRRAALLNLRRQVNEL